MTAEWITSPAARKVLLHWGDSRPAWLWSADGTAALWRNAAARAFGARAKKSGIRLASDVTPIKGQIARLVRLGTPMRSSLSRVQFLADGRPLSATCAVTPVPLTDGSAALLVVGIDPIDPELSGEVRPDRLSETLFSPASPYLFIEDGEIRAGSPEALELFGAALAEGGMPQIEGESGEIELGGQRTSVELYEASPHGGRLVVFTGALPAGAERRRIDVLREDEGAGGDGDPVVPGSDEPLLPLGLTPAPAAPEPTPALADHWVEPFEPRPEVPGLTNLFDRLADDEGLYAPLTESDATYAGPLHENVGYTPPAEEPAPVEPEAPEPDYPDQEVIAAVIDYAEDEIADPAPQQPAESDARPRLWKITGRGFIPTAEAPAEATQPEPELPPADGEPADLAAADSSEAPPPGDVEQVSRYNFDELSRILADRVGADPVAPADTERTSRPAGEGSLINLAADTFVLNRLPIGILVFRDQQVLFSNRAFTDLVGYESIDALRQAGLSALFPDTEPGLAGPVTQLMRRDGDSVAVRARLQSIPWQGRPALLLSAMAGEEPRNAEATVVAFAELAAEAQDEGFLRADRAGLVNAVSLHARVLLGRPEDELLGRPVSDLIEAESLPGLREFLERPARLAETSRPSFAAASADGRAEIVLFAEGQAGIVSGYFGFIRGRGGRSRDQAATDTLRPASILPGEEVEAAMLVRLSRSIRRPLNTIIGFADLIRSTAFGASDTTRYVDYASDIKTAGAEIATLIDELDDYARLREGRYAARPAELDLAALLENCIVRVRGQANAARVLVRSAISERLPHIRADRASLGQAVLNLLASAIDQTPAGASVILSAQLEEDGSIAVNVRDSSETRVDLGERFVVFRDGVGRNGEALAPVRSSVGLALTRSLLAVNTCRLSVDPSGGVGIRFSMIIPAELVAPAP